MLYDIYTMTCKRCGHTIEEHASNENSWVISLTPSWLHIKAWPFIIRRCEKQNCTCKNFEEVK